MKAKEKNKYEVVLREKDLRRDTFRAGGKGGQHQNKTDSAVRYTHIPTGISAESRSDRSQHANDAIALESLKEKILGVYLMQRKASARERYDAKPDAVFGMKMRSYVLHGSIQRVVDHETGWEGDPKHVLSGQIDDLLKTRLMEAAW